MLQWLINNLNMLITALLAVSEATAAVCQLLFPQNKGISGFLASIIKLLQAISKDKNPVE